MELNFKKYQITRITIFPLIQLTGMFW